jgi:DNA-binding transcriptional MerR regulator
MHHDEPVAADELMTIGRFAHISGLSVHTLRHYDDVGLLPPAVVDPATGYRRYRRQQVRQARLIQALRGIDLPIEEIRTALGDASGDGARHVLRTHRSRLEREQSRMAARLADVDHYLEKGITMSPITGSRPVQLKITVDDADAAIAFYQKAFGFHYDVTRRTEDADYSSFVFSKYGEDDFFLLHLLADPNQADRLGPTTFGLLVEDLDDAHSRALEAGATEIAMPHDVEGMPRCSAVTDPSGNWIWLYQG